MRCDSPGPVLRLVDSLQEVAAERSCGRPRRARLMGRAPFALLQDASDWRTDSGAACSQSRAVGSDTPCISMLMQKAEGLSLHSAQPPARDALAKATRALEASTCYSSPSPQLPMNNPKRKLWESPAGDLAGLTADSDGCARRRSRSAPLKRRCGGVGAAASMPTLPTCGSNPGSPLPSLGICISAPEPMITCNAAAAIADEDRRRLAAFSLAAPTVLPAAAQAAAKMEQQLDAVAGMLACDMGVQLSEGSQDDTMCSPEPRVLPSTCAAPAVKQRMSLLHASPASILPEVENAAIGLPSIEPETLAEALTGRHDWPVDRLLLVDCRYEYEHVGGCVLGALNMQDPTEMEDATIGAAGRVDWSRTAVVFYCEFSSQRGPRMFRHIRNLDRRLHLASYPALAVPHMYVLAGGYKAFQELYPQLCTPSGGYVRMVDKRFDAELKQQHGLSKAAWCRKDGRKKAAQPRSACEAV